MIMTYSKWLAENTASLSGKTVAISGSTGGIGRELCRYFLLLGAKLILLDRNMKKSLALAEELKADFDGAKISHVKVDLENVDEVISAADELLSVGVDFLILNAGAYSIPRHRCSTGYDNVFQINFISPYVLAKLLLPHISARGGKVVAVGSIAHNYSVSDMSDIDFSGKGRASLVYGNAKRYLMLSMMSLREYGESVAVAHPGIALTNITAHYPKLIFALIKYPMKVIFMSPKKAALSILKALFEKVEEYEWIGPRIFDVWGYPKKKKPLSFSHSERERVFAVAEKIYSEIINR